MFYFLSLNLKNKKIIKKKKLFLSLNYWNIYTYIFTSIFVSKLLKKTLYKVKGWEGNLSLKMMKKIC